MFIIIFDYTLGLVSNGIQIIGSTFVQTLVRELHQKAKNGAYLLDVWTHVNRVLQKNASTVEVPFIISSLKERVLLGPMGDEGTDTIPAGTVAKDKKIK